MSALWTSRDLRDATKGAIAGEISATGVSIDSRSLQPGDLFIALTGESSDGHAHVAAALAKGAAGAVVHDPDVGDDPRLLRVVDTAAALTALGRAGRQRFEGKLVAVTGSVGKTTTKEMLRTALGALGATHAALASHNNHWGVPLTLALLPPAAEFCVGEIGMNHPGEIAPLAALARPDVAIITNVGATHIGHMGSLEAIAREKSALLESLGPDGIAIVPDDLAAIAPHLMLRLERRFPGRMIRLGGSAARITELSLDARGSRMTVLLGGERVETHLSAPGRHMAGNALACLAAVHALGGDVHRAAEALSRFTPGDGRGAWLRLLGGRAWLLDESYNASGASVRAALELLRLQPAQRRVVALGDMLELGEFARAEHESLAGSVRESADIVYCCGRMMKHLYDLLPASSQGGLAPDSATLAPLVAASVRAGDVVLVKGSHGSRMRDVVTALAGRPG